jgi:hypothetical protein
MNKTIYDLQTTAFTVAQSTLGLNDHDANALRDAAFNSNGFDAANDYDDFVRLHANIVNSFKVWKNQPTKGTIASRKPVVPTPTPTADK